MAGVRVGRGEVLLGGAEADGAARGAGELEQRLARQVRAAGPVADLLELDGDAVGHGGDCGALHAGGGGIQNQMLCQATANALGIEVLAGPVEATSCGNIITQMIATGDISDFPTGRQLIRESFDFVIYTPQDQDTWDEAYADFLKLIG